MLFGMALANVRRRRGECSLGTAEVGRGTGPSSKGSEGSRSDPPRTGPRQLEDEPWPCVVFHRAGETSPPGTQRSQSPGPAHVPVFYLGPAVSLRHRDSGHSKPGEISGTKSLLIDLDALPHQSLDHRIWVSTGLSAKRDRMAAQRAGLLSLPFSPGPQDRRAVRAEDRRRLDWHHWLSGAGFPNTDFPGLRIVPEDGGGALLVSKLDLLAEIDPGD
jgi:hypothetical protein